MEPFPFCLPHLPSEPPPISDRLYRTMPQGDTRPLQVTAVAIPYLVVRKRNGKTEMLDLRRAAVARVDAAFARAALAKPRPKKRKRKARGKRSNGKAG